MLLLPLCFWWWWWCTSGGGGSGDDDGGNGSDKFTVTYLHLLSAVWIARPGSTAVPFPRRRG